MKNVVITGSSSGFGFLAARAFADKGYKVWATMRNAESTNTGRKHELQAASPNIRVITMDVADDASVADAIDEVMTEDGRVDVLINNAGIMYVGHTEAYSIPQVHEQMNVNFYGVIRTTQAVLPHMREAGNGLIINTTSTAGRVAYPYFGTYGATKFALEAYSQSMHYEMALHGVDVVVVEPGPFATNLINSIKPGARQEVLQRYGALRDVPGTMLKTFIEFFASGAAPDNALVADAYLAVAETERGQRPMRTPVGIDHGVGELNRLTQPIQDDLLRQLNLDTVLMRRD